MAFTNSPSFAAEHGYRYSVSRRMTEGASYDALTIDGTYYTEYCDTFAEAKRRMQHHAKALQANALSFNWVQYPSTWLAEAVQYRCKTRKQPFVVARAADNKRSEWITVIAL